MQTVITIYTIFVKKNLFLFKVTVHILKTYIKKSDFCYFLIKSKLSKHFPKICTEYYFVLK